MMKATPPLPPLDWDALNSACQSKSASRYREVAEKFLKALKALDTMRKGAACKHAQLTRPTFDRWYKEFVAGGCSAQTLRALAEGKPHSSKTSPVVTNRIIEFGRQNPDKSAYEIADILRDEFRGSGYAFPSKTFVRNTLRAHGLEKVLRPYAPRFRDFLWSPENQTNQLVSNSTWSFMPLEQQLGTSLLQNVFFVRVGTSLSSSHSSSSPSSENIGGGIGSVTQVDALYVHAVLDIKSEYVWANLYTERRGSDALDLLRDVCAFYALHQLKPTTIDTAKRPEFCKPQGNWNRHHAYADYQGFLVEQNIQHAVAPHSSYQHYRLTSKFDKRFEKFARIVRDDFFAPWRKHQQALHKSGKAADNFETLRAHFTEWIKCYNALNRKVVIRSERRVRYMPLLTYLRECE